MPIYRVKVKGADKLRLVRATSAAQARNHVAEADAISADEMADLLASGVELETASTDPAPELPAPTSPSTEEKPKAPAKVDAEA